MLKFEVGKKYQCKSICDSNCIWTYEVISRTDKTIKIKSLDGDTVKSSYKPHMYYDVESIYPLGKYSMCPVLMADDLV